MEREIMVSVIMLAYNQEAYIAQAIESVLAQQTDFRFELLIGDDASNDLTPQIIREYAQRAPDRLRPLLRRENLGATRNLCDLLSHAQGKYIAYLEGDDFWNNDTKLQRQVSFLENHAAYIGCTHRCRIVDEAGIPCKKQYLSWISRAVDYTERDFKGLVLPGHPSTLVHRNIFVDDEDTWRPLIECDPLIGDRSLALLLMARGPIRQLPQVMSSYRRRRDQNATTVAYTRNTDCIRSDYAYTKKLARFAGQLGVDGGFQTHYRDLFVSAVWHGLRDADSLTLARQIAREGHPSAYVLYLPWGVVKKVIQKRKEERES